MAFGLTRNTALGLGADIPKTAPKPKKPGKKRPTSAERAAKKEQTGAAAFNKRVAYGNTKKNGLTSSDFGSAERDRALDESQGVSADLEGFRDQVNGLEPERANLLGGKIAGVLGRGTAEGGGIMTGAATGLGQTADAFGSAGELAAGTGRQGARIGYEAGGAVSGAANAGQTQFGQDLQTEAQGRGGQLGAVNLARSAAMGQQPSVAQLQGRRQMEQAIANQFAMGAGGRGTAQAGGMRQAQMGAARLQQQAAQDAGMLRAQEMATGRGQLLQGTESLRAGDLGRAGATTDQTGMLTGALTDAGNLGLAGNAQALEGQGMNLGALEGQAGAYGTQAGVGQAISETAIANASTLLQQAGLNLDEAKQLNAFELNKLGLDFDTIQGMAAQVGFRSDAAADERAGKRGVTAGQRTDRTVRRGQNIDLGTRVASGLGTLMQPR